MKKTINFAGEEMGLKKVFNEKTDPKWDNEAQDLIDDNKAKGKKACCIHEGPLHGYYEEKQKLFKE